MTENNAQREARFIPQAQINVSSFLWSRHRPGQRWGVGQRDVIYPAKSSGDGSGVSIVCLLPHNLRACANRKDSDQPQTLTT